ncbi:MAG: DUF4388 domain-containing protein [bacterium]|nr:DUF4388 domain-containing protein [bacterium]
MALIGDITDFPLPEVVQLIGIGKKTGKLTIECKRDGACFYFKDGIAVFAHPQYRKDKLGEVIIRSGVITREQLETALNKQGKMAKIGIRPRIGTVLVDLGFLGEEDLIVFIENEIKDCIYRVLTEKKGKYEFLNDYDLSDRDVIASLSVENIILDAIREVDEWKEINSVLGDFDSVYVISVDPEFDFGDFNMSEWKVVTLINGKRSINEITSVAKLNRLDVCKILIRLIKYDVIRILKQPPSRGKIKKIGYNKPKAGIIKRIVNRLRSF